MVELHHRAKFRQNRLYRGRDMAIFRFFKMAAAAILDFQNFKFFTAGTVKWVELHQRAKFRENRLNRAEIWQFFDFSKMAAVRHLGFVMHVSGPPMKGIWWSLSLCKIWLESMQWF